jgi:hypothetical protein
MAQALVWGLTFATMITLILIPCLYAIVDDVTLWRHRGRLRAEAASNAEPKVAALGLR